jgi:FkbM family methyltransferase
LGAVRLPFLNNLKGATLPPSPKELGFRVENKMKRALCMFLLAVAYLQAEPELQPDHVFQVTENISNCVDDPHELEQYIASFPEQDYIVCHVPQQGNFYVEPNRQDTIKNVLRSGENWEPHILRMINKYAKPGTAVLDIGSHIGTFTFAMSKAVGDSGTVFAFEPQRKIYRELRKNCELNGIKNAVCHRVAIGDQPQIIEMDIETYPGSEGSTGIGHGGDRAEMRTIDSFNFSNISFIKIDVERSEEQVLDGMVNTILTNKPVIVIELQGGYLWESAPSDIKQKMVDTIEKLQKLGYDVTRIYLHDYLALPVR